jgi:phosphatidylglycerol:prolipoprotein diacylglycerol transferase
VPDPQFVSQENIYGFAFNMGHFGITMGQALSIPMVLFGFVFVLIALQRKF